LRTQSLSLRSLPLPRPPRPSLRPRGLFSQFHMIRKRRHPPRSPHSSLHISIAPAAGCFLKLHPPTPSSREKTALRRFFSFLLLRCLAACIYTALDQLCCSSTRTTSRERYKQQVRADAHPRYKYLSGYCSISRYARRAVYTRGQGQLLCCCVYTLRYLFWCSSLRESRAQYSSTKFSIRIHIRCTIYRGFERKGARLLGYNIIVVSNLR
jgi:hypothetical protein